MPIRPIDLQTMLLQLNQVGKDQVAAREGAAVQGALKGAAEQKRQVENKEALRAPEEAEAGSEAVRDRQEGQGGPGRRKPGGREEPVPEEKPEEVVRDPELGGRLDISG